MFRYFLRVIYIFIESKLRPGKIDFIGTSVIRRRVWPRYADSNLHLNNGALNTFFDFGRFDYVIRTGVFTLMRKNKWEPVAGTTMTRFRISLPLMAAFEIHTRVACWDEKWCYFEQRIIYKGEVAARAFIKALFRKNGKPVPPSKITDQLGVHYDSPPFPEEISQWLKAEETMRLGLRRN